MSTAEETLKLAVLIDSDNVSYVYVKPMLEEIARYGTPTIKRIYGDWTQPEAAGWKNVLLENAITPIQQYRYTSGKNSTDSTLIIDAMDILYTERVSGFCIVSSDSDFTRLATRLREAGMLVIGIGEEKTPSPFIAACDRFIFLEIIAPKNEHEEEKKKPEPQMQRRGKVPKEVRNLVRSSGRCGQYDPAQESRVRQPELRLQQADQFHQVIGHLRDRQARHVQPRYQTYLYPRRQFRPGGKVTTAFGPFSWRVKTDFSYGQYFLKEKNLHSEFQIRKKKEKNHESKA